MYNDSLLLSERLRAAHTRALETIARPGPRFSARERCRIVQSGRGAMNCSLCARRKTALTPGAVAGGHDDTGGLPPTMIDAIHRIRTDPARLTRSWFDSVVAEIGQPAYIEMVSVLNTSVIIDTLHTALDLPLPALPAAQPGSPTGAPTGDVVDDGAWVPITRASREMADTGLPVVPNIVRAMGLVPDAVDLFFSTFAPHYALKDIPLSLSQAQAELVASRVSAVNECFY